MNKHFTPFVIVLIVLAGLAIYLAKGAFHRGNSALFVVMIAIAVIFWNRSQKKT